MVVGIDVCNGKVVIKGWVEEIDVMVIDFVKLFEDVGVVVIIYIDIMCDGVMKGLNIDVIEVLVCVVLILVIVLGGVLFLDDFKVLKVIGVIFGVILGCVFYDGVIDLNEVFSIFKG